MCGEFRVNIYQSSNLLAYSPIVFNKLENYPARFSSLIIWRDCNLISSERDPACKDVNAWFTTVPFKSLSQKCMFFFNFHLEVLCKSILLIGPRVQLDIAIYAWRVAKIYAYSSFKANAAELNSTWSWVGLLLF